jgi:outer membrane protein OmpA-like peptidoglycan-associated protein
MKNNCSLLLLTLVLFSLPACGRKSKKHKSVRSKKIEKRIKTASLSGVDIPLERSFLAMNENNMENEEMQEDFFEPEDTTNMATDDSDLEENVEQPSSEDSMQDLDMTEEPSAISESDSEIEDSIEPDMEDVQDNTQTYNWADIAQDQDILKAVYFDFDKSKVRDDQKETVVYDVEQVKELLAQARQGGVEPTVVIEGHACHSAGTKVYNLAISENRAKTVADLFKDHGVPQGNIKIVGRGDAIPVTVDGKKVTGSRKEQWVNRRVQVYIISA